MHPLVRTRSGPSSVAQGQPRARGRFRVSRHRGLLLGKFRGTPCPFLLVLNVSSANIAGTLCTRIPVSCNVLLSETDIFSYVDDAGAEQFMYIGDHWQSAPDRLKAHGERAENPVGIASNPLTLVLAFFRRFYCVGASCFFR